VNFVGDNFFEIRDVNLIIRLNPQRIVLNAVVAKEEFKSRIVDFEHSLSLDTCLRGAASAKAGKRDG
jgi:hypothetical protein